MSRDRFAARLMRYRVANSCAASQSGQNQVLTLMPKLSSPYKNSIWRRDPRYDLNRAALSPEDFETISRLGSVDVAKKQVPPLPGLALLAICKAAKQLPATDEATPEEVQHYLETTLTHHGAGIPTLICMLAVESNGDFPPMDRKFAAGLLIKKVISQEDKVQLLGKDPINFCKVYVKKVIPAWRKSRETRTAEQADNYWGRGGLDEA